MIKRLLALLAILIFAFFVSPLSAYAHNVKTQGSLTVEIHVDPDENPIPEDPTHLYFSFQDKADTFHLQGCDCRISILEGNKTLLSQKLPTEKLQNSVFTTELPFTFPSYDLYKIILTGEPMVGYNFQPFTFTWDFRVDPDTPGFVTGLSNIQIIILSLIAIAIFFAVFAFFLRREILEKDEFSSHKKKAETKK